MPYVTINTKVQKIVRGVPGPPGDPTQPFTSIKMDTTTGEPAIPIQGEMWWDIEEETYSVKQDGATLQVGQEVQWPVSNKTGSTILDGTAVMAIGTVGATGRILIAPMDGITPANAKFLLGVATHDIGNNEQGKVTAFGKVRDMDTTGASEGETWADEDILWISDSVAGQLTNIQPARDSIGMPVAFVINANANVGVLSIRITPINEHLLVTEDQRDALDNANTPTALNPIATIADLSGMWELVTTEKVTVAVQEVLFTGLDFDAYDYKLWSRIYSGTVSLTSGIFWYSREANANATVATDYRVNRLWAGTVYNDNQFSQNIIERAAVSLGDRFLETLIAKNADETLCAMTTGYIMDRDIVNTGVIGTMCLDYVGTPSVSTKFGVYVPSAGGLGIGSEFLLYRRARL